ncbi:MAG: hypothetical protein ACX939_11465 [Hyphococcus sp.]
MISGSGLLQRGVIIAAMTGLVMGLMNLTAPTPRADRPDASEKATAMADAWSGDMQWGAPYAALTPLRTDISATAAASFDPADDYAGLPRSPGVDTVAGLCGACHSLSIVMQQRQDAAGWTYLLNWMVEKQGMPEPAPETRREIIDYLTREFGRA